MRATGNIVELRRLLAERFPHTGLAPDRAKPDQTCPTGASALDALLGGGLPKGELTELVGAGPGSGSAQIIHALLRRVAADGQFLALVDGTDSFDVDAVEPDVLARLLWVRCANANEALKAADFLLRDRNFPILVLDLKLNPAVELRKIQSSVWFRFKRLLEQNQTTFLVVTPQPFVGGATCRVRVQSKLSLDALARTPSEALADLKCKLLRAAKTDEVEPAAQLG